MQTLVRSSIYHVGVVDQRFMLVLILVPRNWMEGGHLMVVVLNHRFPRDMLLKLLDEVKSHRRCPRRRCYGVVPSGG